MNGTIALPRSRARRRRRKPPGPGFWWALFWVVYDIFALLLNLFCGTPFNLIVAAFFVMWLARRDWPRFIREWDAWRDGE